MNNVAVYNNELRVTFTRNDRSHGDVVRISSARHAEEQIRSLIDLSDLRDTGAFFTSEKFVKQAIDYFDTPISESSTVIDPTCGTGNFLVAASQFLPLRKSLHETIDDWGQVLRGYDISPEFVECTKLRIILAAVARGAVDSAIGLEDLESRLRYIKVGNALEHTDTLSKASHVLLNPPYNYQESPNECAWSTGKVNAAAIFVDHVLSNLSEGAQFTMVLPDVLRSGSRYSKWRKHIGTLCSYDLKEAGKFDKRTDVDVFFYYGSSARNQFADNCWTEKSVGITIEDKFDVSIGPLVAYRDKEIGNSALYLDSRSFRHSETIEKIRSKRRTKSKLINPPFVVVKRTSSPSDRIRAKAALVSGNQPIAIENHLIVLKPKKGGLNACRSLIKILQQDSTNNFLNSRIRCRHLTVGSVKEIPWTKT